MRIFVSKGNEKADYKVVNAMALELAQYGYALDSKLIKRIATNTERNEICDRLVRAFTLGKLNPPLFKNWEERTYFSFGEVVVQILGYIFQISGNDLDDPDYMSTLLSKVNKRKFKRIQLETDESSKERFLSLVNSKVSLNRKQYRELVNLASSYFLLSPRNLRS